MAARHVKDFLVQRGAISATASEQEIRDAAVKAVHDKLLTHKQLGGLLDEQDHGGGQMDTGIVNPTSTQVFGGAPNVKSPSSRYKTTKYTAKHARTGQPVKGINGREIETLSELEHAKLGTFFKLSARKSGIHVEFKEHEQALLNEMFETDTWCGEIGGRYEREFSGQRAKAALLEDNTSGGLFVSPYWFDDAIVTFPLLYSELMPYVDLVDMPRASEVKSASIANPTVSWNTAEGTSITEFDSTSLINSIDQSVRPVTYATELGRDLLADADVTDLGGRVVQTVGGAMLKEMDRVIAIGDGTTQPQGIVNMANPTFMQTMNGMNGPLVLSDLEALVFGLPKQYRVAQNRIAFIGSDKAYFQCRAMPIGIYDSRRILGENEGDYTVLTYPYRVQQDIPYNQLIFGALAKYRLWRRQGQEVRMTDQGVSLMLRNTVAIVVRGRWAGQVVDPNAFLFYNDLDET